MPLKGLRSGGYFALRFYFIDVNAVGNEMAFSPSLTTPNIVRVIGLPNQISPSVEYQKMPLKEAFGASQNLEDIVSPIIVWRKRIWNKNARLSAKHFEGVRLNRVGVDWFGKDA